MSRLQYGPAGNQIEIDYIHTQSVKRVPKYSDDGTEYLWTSITINVQGTVNGALHPAMPGETPDQTLLRVQHTLEVPRQQLTFTAGAGAYVVSPPVGFSIDANSGPFPRDLTITQIGGTQTFMVNYTIETFLVECPGGTAPQYASWRYRVTDTKDENLYTTLTTSGKIVTRSDLNVNPDSLRGIFSPGIPPGFKRMSSSYTLQEDGRAVTYDFVDRELYLQPPNPSTTASGEYIISTNDGMVMFSEVRVRLEGPKVTAKADLIGLAMLIAQTKLTAAGVNLNVIPMVGGIQESLYENTVEIRLRAKVGRPLTRKAGVNTDLSMFGGPLPGSLPGTLPFDPGTRGTAGIQMLAGVLNDPCLQQNVLVTCGPGTTQPVGLEPVLEATVILTPVLPDDQGTLVTLSTSPGLYTDYKVNSRYELHSGAHALPIASSAPVGGDTVFVQLAARRKVLVAEWTAEKIGSHPVVPDFLDLADSNAVLIHRSDTEPMETDLAADGVSIIYRVRGRDVYGFKDQTKVDYEFPLAPWLSAQIGSVSTLTAVDFAQGIIRPAGGGQVQLQGGGQPPNNQGF